MCAGRKAPSWSACLRMCQARSCGCCTCKGALEQILSRILRDQDNDHTTVGRQWLPRTSAALSSCLSLQRLVPRVMADTQPAKDEALAVVSGPLRSVPKLHASAHGKAATTLAASQDQDIPVSWSLQPFQASALKQPSLCTAVPAPSLCTAQNLHRGAAWLCVLHADLAIQIGVHAAQQKEKAKARLPGQPSLSHVQSHTMRQCWFSRP